MAISLQTHLGSHSFWTSPESAAHAKRAAEPLRWCWLSASLQVQSSQSRGTQSAQSNPRSRLPTSAACTCLRRLHTYATVYSIFACSAATSHIAQVEHAVIWPQALAYLLTAAVSDEGLHRGVPQHIILGCPTDIPNVGRLQ